jgi:hypothetical protein
MNKKEYIEREVVLELIRKKWFYNGGQAFQALLDLPTADVEPARHGKLTFAGVHEDQMMYKCSECWHAFPWKSMNYCPNCGTKFIKETD